MLKFILGRSGSGKTTSVIEKIKDLSNSEKKCILITPEQASFEYEKMIALNKDIDASYVEVLNFSRLAKLSFNKLGGPAKELLSKTGSYLMMNIALEEIKDDLSVYKRHYQSYGFISSLLTTYEECRQAGVSPEKLSNFSFGADDGLLKEKSFELSLIFDSYSAVVGQSYVDPSDILEIAGNKLEGSDYFKNTTILFDGFTGFSALQYDIIKSMITQADDVYFALCCDGEDQDNEVLQATAKTKSRLERMALVCGIPLGGEQILSPGKRYACEQLRQLEQLSANYPVIAPKKGDDIGFYAASSGYDEIEWVCAKICELLREKGFRYRDIAIIPRSMGRYQAYIEKIFAKYGISYYMDTIKDARSQVVVKWLMLAAEIGAKGCDTELMLEFLKSPLLRVSTELVAQVENYCYIWSIKGNGWKQEFKNHPDGLVEGIIDRAKKQLENIEKCRKNLMAILKPFIDKDYIWDGKTFATALFELFSPKSAEYRKLFARPFKVVKTRYKVQMQKQQNKIKPSKERLNKIKNLHKKLIIKTYKPTTAKENLLAYAGFLVNSNAMNSIEARVFLEEQSTLWGQICDVLDLFAEFLNGVKVTKRKLLELLELAFGTLELSSVPHTLDQVLVGTADRIRPSNPKVVFILGAVEGEYPLLCTPSGLLTDGDRKKMEQQGVELFGGCDELMEKEKMFCYQALNCASHNVFISYPKSHSDDKNLVASTIYADAFEHWGDKGDCDDNVIGRVVNKNTAAYHLAACYKSTGELKASLLEYLNNSDGSDIAKSLERWKKKTPYHIDDTSVSKGIFGTQMRVSPSKIDRYNSCPFSYYANTGLGLRPRMKAELNPLQSGSVVHLALEKIVSKYGGKNLSTIDEQELKSCINEIITSYLDGRLGDIKSLSSRDRYLFIRLGDSIYDLVRRLGDEFSQSSFEPLHFEMQIEEESDAQPIVLETADGTKISVIGTVDRVDIAEINGQKYVRVVDYKARGKNFKLSDVFYGLNMQMLIYLFSIWKCGKNELADMLPAGVLYMPNISKFHSVERSDDGNKLKAEINKHYRMNGLILDDPDVIKAMDINASGVFIPKRSDKSAQSFMVLEDLGKLYQRVESEILLMAQRLIEGNVEARPTVSSTVVPCEYCDYYSICGFEQGDEIRHQFDVHRSEVLGEETFEEVVRDEQ